MDHIETARLRLRPWKESDFDNVDEKDTNAFVGAAGLWQSPGWPELELGYWLVKESRERATHSKRA